MKKRSSDHKTKKTIAELIELARLCRGDIIKMTTIAGSGHPAGSMSSIDIYVALFNYARVSPLTFNDISRLFGLDTSSFKITSLIGANVSKPFATSQGQPFFFASD